MGYCRRYRFKCSSQKLERKATTATNKRSSTTTPSVRILVEVVATPHPPVLTECFALTVHLNFVHTFVYSEEDDMSAQKHHGLSPGECQELSYVDQVHPGNDSEQTVAHKATCTPGEKSSRPEIIEAAVSDTGLVKPEMDDQPFQQSWKPLSTLVNR